MSTPTTIQARLVPFSLSLDGVTYKNVVCKKAWNFSGDNTINQEESDCATHTSLGANKWSFDFELIMNTTPSTATEMSGQEILSYWQTKQRLYVKVLYSTSFLISGEGYLNVKVSAPQGGLLAVSGTFTGDGDVDVTP